MPDNIIEPFTKRATPPKSLLKLIAELLLQLPYEEMLYLSGEVLSDSTSIVEKQPHDIANSLRGFARRELKRGEPAS
jgi:hypothetical protein